MLKRRREKRPAEMARKKKKKSVLSVPLPSLTLGTIQILFLSLPMAWGGVPVLIMWMMTTNRQEVGSEHTLLIFLKGMEIAFRKPNGFFCLPSKFAVLWGVMPVKS